jgi:hypothetical protein
MFRFHRGEVVEYQRNLYFIQPNGTSSYLYNYLEDVGCPTMRVHNPLTSECYKIAATQARKFINDNLKKPNREMITIPDSPRQTDEEIVRGRGEKMKTDL